jgi:hypothetical protein
MPLSAIVLLASVNSIQPTAAAELRPLILPGVQQGHIQQQRPTQPTVAPVYGTFENRVKRMSPAQKNAYKARYTRELEEAVKKQDHARIDHFNRLLQILGRY